MSRIRRPVLAGLVASAVLVAGCTLPVFSPGGENTAPDAGAAASAGASVDAWKSCPEVPQQLVGQRAPNIRYECTTIKVPKDWSAGAAGGETFDLALMRVRATTQRDRIGSLVINPGGPGGSGIDTAAYLSFGEQYGGLPTEILNRFDVVGFDPRGVKRSSPVECISDEDTDATFGADPDPDTDSEFAQLVALNQRIGATCGAKYGDELRLFSTEQAARDLDAIRTAVGDEKLTYLGYSYGTLLGATYAQLFPRNIRAMVLDGAIDPNQDYIAGSEGQAKGFELAFKNFSEWCAETADKCPIAPDARAALVEVLEKARVSPLADASGRLATAGWVFYAVVASLYTELYWESLAKAIAGLQDGDPTAAFKQADTYSEREADGSYPNQTDAMLAVNCADEDETITVEQVRTLQNQWRTKYPLFGPPLAVGMLGCVYWPGQRDPYPTGAAQGAPPIVVVGTTGDPATPYEQTATLAKMLGVGRVLTWEGDGHTAYPNTTCIVSAVDGYLLNGVVPPEGLRCPAK